MEPSARKRFQKIEAILQSVARQQAAAEARARKEQIQTRRLDSRSRARDRQIAVEVRTRLDAEFKARDERVEAEWKKQDERLDAEFRKRDERLEAEFKERDEKWEARVQRTEARLDKRMDAIAKLIQTGMRLIVRIEARQADTELRLAEVTQKLDALIMVVDGIVKRPGSGPH
ncbi:MAG: hypothetical protein DMG57_04390 [Acidobacteria bacterium]|nr:MAG: hypothetical protein DMG57_04390 [Acidobacteriota bacterium]